MPTYREYYLIDDLKDWFRANVSDAQLQKCAISIDADYDNDNTLGLFRDLAFCRSSYEDTLCHIIEKYAMAYCDYEYSIGEIDFKLLPRELGDTVWMMHYIGLKKYSNTWHRIKHLFE